MKSLSLKLTLKIITLSTVLPFIQNCASAPEIKPAEELPPYTVEQLQGSSETRDEVFQIEPIGMSENEDPSKIAEDIALEDEALQASDEAEKLVIKDEPSDVAMEPKELEEENIVMAAAKPKVKVNAKKESRAIASVSQFKNGFHKFAKNCMMKSEPNSGSADAGSVNAGKKLWLDSHDGQWFKAYKKSGAVYIPANCIK